MIFRFFLVALPCLIALEAHAFGLSMHGTPKYSPDSAHLEYANPDAPKGGTKKQAAIGTFDTLNPFSIQGKSAAGLNLFYDRLSVRVWDEPFSLYPLIASTLEIPEDRSSLTITIDPRARFHDGSSVTAEDILFSFETLKEHGRPNMRAVYRLVETTDILEDGRIFFSFGPGHDRETAMVLAMMPVLSKAWWDGRDFSKTLLDIPNGNGPYRITAIDPGRRIVYERDPAYWAADHFASIGHYNFERVVYDYFRDSSVAFEAFKAGDLNVRRELDITRWLIGYEDLPDHLRLETLPHSRPERARGFIFNMRRAPFDDIRVRQALTLLFDFEWVNENLYGGAYSRVQSIYPNAILSDRGDEAYTAPMNADRTAIRSNRRLAQNLLQQAGWTLENAQRSRNGQTLEFELLLDNPAHEKIALHFQRALEREGITVRIRTLDSAAFRGRLSAYDFDMVSYFWLSSLSPGTEQILYWGCQAAQEPSRWNFMGICDEDVDQLAGEMAQTKSYDALIEKARALDRILMANNIMIPLYYSGVDRFAFDAAIHHPEKTPLYGAVLETWWMEAESTGKNLDE